jgi:hypothetical protein
MEIIAGGSGRLRTLRRNIVTETANRNVVPNPAVQGLHRRVVCHIFANIRHVRG